MKLGKLPAPLIALALSAFAIGTTEFVIMGLLPQVAGNLRVSIPTAGWLVSGYALGVFIGAPIMAVLTQKLPHRSALMVLMGIFILGNAFCALSPSYGFLMAARIVTALCHGAFFGIGSVEAASLVPANKRASAIALMFTGLTLANVLGVPLGTALGQLAGWRTTFWAVAGIGVAAFVGLATLLPRHAAAHRAPDMLRELGALRGPVWLALSITVVSSASIFAIFTYIAPILNVETQVCARGVSYTLFLIGIGLTIGNFVGGRLADWRLNATLIGTFLASAAILGIFALTAHYWVAAEITLFAWATVAFCGVPALQINVVNYGKAAPNLISTLNIAAFNAGNALGAWVGGEVIAGGAGAAGTGAAGLGAAGTGAAGSGAAGTGLASVPVAAALLSLGALLLTLVSVLPARRRLGISQTS